MGTQRRAGTARREFTPRAMPALRLAALAILVPVLGLTCAAPPKPTAATRPLAVPRDLPGLPNFARVSEALYRGAQPTREGFQRLREMGVTTVVDLRGKSHRDELEGLGLKYIHIPSSAAHIEEQKVIQFLRIVQDPANQPVFVHCERGADRTGAYVAAYRMVEQDWSAHDARAELGNFHFSPFWQDIPAFLDKLDVGAVGRQAQPATSTAPTTRE